MVKIRNTIFQSVQLLLLLISEGDKHSQRDVVLEKEINVEEI